MSQDMAKEHPDCAYCAKGELVKKFGYEICELPASTVYLFKEQSHPGRCIVASKYHVSEMLELSAEDRNAFIEDVTTVANAIHKVYNPDKLNYGMYGDTGHHLHMHLVPKYKDEFEWGGTFAMDPDLKKVLDESELERIAAPIRDAILKNA
ncbi:HIT family protein [Oribacterium sp. WCC10]|uniref:HIT family protein n=1 Tax=Oribacterium sp. WCC10 TaxID=1855343 RepID=UPI0008F453FB|nr:HIT family protein [Oribacterium sp. WCC10]SFG15639.1 Diadenosine tetraphosphate (Ap4A) hydrolase [Oribacterium sp. WCC10]